MSAEKIGLFGNYINSSINSSTSSHSTKSQSDSLFAQNSSYNTHVAATTTNNNAADNLYANNQAPGATSTSHSSGHTKYQNIFG